MRPPDDALFLEVVQRLANLLRGEEHRAGEIIFPHPRASREGVDEDLGGATVVVLGVTHARQALAGGGVAVERPRGEARELLVLAHRRRPPVPRNPKNGEEAFANLDFFSRSRFRRYESSDPGAG